MLLRMGGGCGGGLLSFLAVIHTPDEPSPDIAELGWAGAALVLSPTLALEQEGKQQWQARGGKERRAGIFPCFRLLKSLVVGGGPKDGLSRWWE